MPCYDIYHFTTGGKCHFSDQKSQIEDEGITFLLENPKLGNFSKFYFLNLLKFLWFFLVEPFFLLAYRFENWLICIAFPLELSNIFSRIIHSRDPRTTTGRSRTRTEKIHDQTILRQNGRSKGLRPVFSAVSDRIDRPLSIVCLWANRPYTRKVGPSTFSSRYRPLFWPWSQPWHSSSILEIKRKHYQSTNQNRCWNC